ncbi:class I SAM-dependent methyltransferase [soil metagenome]|nr:SAM-dependent methyltransferase [Afipia sp.]OUX62654.1 MAG: SAM-dependent methyltransferase [Afipia sp. TMED4]HAQ94725.1 SAM-dependent methyltransferase [Afipia sp.]HBF53807.1 SAM-dependent methyltransferase [Afipia sp.]HBR44018.1 SAM-dependent methyltransferase [Afipia sp.]
MNNTDRQAHWQKVYAVKAEKEVSWFQENPAPSLDLIAATGISTDASIIDVGGGASRLVDSLLEQGFRRIAILDLSAKALGAAKKRLGRAGEAVDWIVADITSWKPSSTYDLWHDRAAFHFLTEATDRDAYVGCLKKAVRPGGHVIIATFAQDGPERCSGLPIVRYDPDELASTLGPAFELADSRRHDHMTPGGNTQRFQFSRFLRS